MAKYKEVWEAYDNPTVVSYKDTEKPGRNLAPQSQEVAEWIAAGNTPDPAYTAEEIAAASEAVAMAEARAYVLATDPIVSGYIERKAAKLAGRVNTLKYKSLTRKRAVALGRV